MWYYESLKDYSLFLALSLVVIYIVYFVNWTKKNYEQQISAYDFLIGYGGGILLFLFSIFLVLYPGSAIIRFINDEESIRDQLIFAFGTGANMEGIVKFCLLILPVLLLSAKKHSWKNIGIQKPRMRLPMILAISLLAFAVIISGRRLIDIFFFPVLGPDFTTSMMIKYMPHNTVLFFISISIICIGHEVFFRGLVYTALRQRIGFLSALAFTSILFVAFCYKPEFKAVFLLAILIAPVVLTLLYEKTKSIYPGIIVHFFLLSLMKFSPMFENNL